MKTKTTFDELNKKEQRVYEALADGSIHAIKELKALFRRDARQHLKADNGKAGPDDVDRQAQSFVRNNLRRLVQQGWVEGTAQNAKIPRGSYRLTRAGKPRAKKAGPSRAGKPRAKKAGPSRAGKPRAKKAGPSRATAAAKEGLNSKEQRLLNALLDGQAHAIGELKGLFRRDARQHLKADNGKSGPDDVDLQAQSFVRNGLRRLVQQGWVAGSAQNARIPRGTYKLTQTGKGRARRA